MGVMVAELSAVWCRMIPGLGVEPPGFSLKVRKGPGREKRPRPMEVLKETRVARVTSELTSSARASGTSRQGPQDGRLCRLLAHYT